MSDRTWYLFGEAIKREFEEMAIDEKRWFEEHKRLDDMGLASDSFKDFGKKKEYWKAYVNGYVDALAEAKHHIDELYKKLGIEE
jgi:hypothetical protein